MKKILLTIALLLGLNTVVRSERVAPYSGSRIFWDMNSQVTVFNSGNYARMIELQDGRLLAVAEAGGGISIAISENKGKNWSDPKRIVANPGQIFLAVPDVIQLKDGTIVVGYNPRPTEPYSEDRKFGIRVVKSIDNGETWSEPIFVFDAQHTFQDGCWEPSFLELPSGELQCYFANENDYTSSGEQCISMCRSFDKGETWSDPVKISFRANSRDGMPVPILLKDESEIAVIIEDNGWPGRNNFAATTVRTTLEDNWSSGYVDANSPNRNMIFETIPPVGIVSAAPYIRVLPWGETVASYQGNENRSSFDLQYFDMFVLVGDARAKNFKAKSAPFSLDLGHHSIWNSVSVIEDGVVVAVGSIGEPNKNNNVQMIKGYPIRQAKASYGTIKVDGNRSSDEKWTTENADQLKMGNVTKNKTTVDFAYDNDNLYLTARVIDRNIINTGLDNDGVRFFIDADNVSDTEPVQGMYSLFLDTDGSMKLQRGDNGRWVTDSNTDGIQYALNLKSFYYDVEVAIPWNKLGKSSAPVNQRMAIALEIANKEEFRLTNEVIPDVDNNASWTWLEFVLEENSDVANIEYDAPINVKLKDGNIYINSEKKMSRADIFLYNGVLVKTMNINGSYTQMPFPNEGKGILKVVFEDGQIYSQKLWVQ